MMGITETVDKIILVGAGGHALSLMEILPSHKLAGYLSLEKSEAIPADWLGDDSAKSRLIDDGFAFHMAFVYAGLPIMSKRARLIEEYENAGARFESVIAGSAIITPRSVIGAGSAVMNGAIVNRAVIGHNCVVNSGAIVEHDCVVGDNTFIGPGVVIGGAVSIGRDCFIGLGSNIRNCIRIGDGVSVAMGATVTQDLLEPGIYHGNPLRRHVVPERRR